MNGPRLLLASNRGPISFSLDEDGTLTARRGGGGLVSGLATVGDSLDAVWVCAAMNEADRTAARRAPDGRLDLAGHECGSTGVHMLDIDPDTFAAAYNGVANSALWFVHHLLYDTPLRPVFDVSFRRDWDAYVAYNHAFADALAADAGQGAAVMVQDYHLALVPHLLAQRRPDLAIGHFSHTPWAPPDYYRMLPRHVAVSLLEGIVGAGYAAFLTPRWAGLFLDCCADLLGAEVDRTARTVSYAGRVTRIGAHGLGVDADSLRAGAAHSEVDDRVARLRERIGDRAVVARVDRTELSKNIPRGILAFRELLRAHPEWKERVVHLAVVYPSRSGIPEYQAYTEETRRLAQEVNDEFATAGWTPVVLEIVDDYPLSLAAYRLADVLLVNPIRDGMNLVAKEGPLLSQRNCVLVLSREAGAVDELGDTAITINPYDITETAEALRTALLMPAPERAEHCRRLAEGATRLPPQRWLADQLAIVQGLVAN